MRRDPSEVWAAAFGTAYALAFEAAYQAADGASPEERRKAAALAVDVSRVRFVAGAAAAEAAAA